MRQPRITGFATRSASASGRELRLHGPLRAVFDTDLTAVVAVRDRSSRTTNPKAMRVRWRFGWGAFDAPMGSVPAIARPALCSPGRAQHAPGESSSRGIFSAWPCQCGRGASHLVGDLTWCGPAVNASRRRAPREEGGLARSVLAVDHDNSQLLS